jgi:hypothetical protein
MHRIAYFVVCGAWLSYIASMFLPAIYGMFGFQATGMSIVSLVMIPQVIISHITGNVVEEDRRFIDLIAKAGIYGLANVIFLSSCIILLSRAKRIFRLYRLILLLAASIAGSIFFVNVFKLETMTSLPPSVKPYFTNIPGVGTYVWFSSYIVLMIGFYLLERAKFRENNKIQ